MTISPLRTLAKEWRCLANTLCFGLSDGCIDVEETLAKKKSELRVNRAATRARAIAIAIMRFGGMDSLILLMVMAMVVFMPFAFRGLEEGDIGCDVFPGGSEIVDVIILQFQRSLKLAFERCHFRFSKDTGKG